MTGNRQDLSPTQPPAARAELRSTPPLPLRCAILCALSLCATLGARAQLVLPPPASPSPLPRALQATSDQSPSSISGILQDPSGAPLVGATLRLASSAAALSQTAETGAEGRFSFPSVPSGHYRLTVTEPGMAPWQSAGDLPAHTALDLSTVTLALPLATTEIQVTATETEVAAAQVELEEKQRVFGVIPNFYATYLWTADPLTARQKFSLAWRQTTDPVNVAMTGVVAGVEQWQHDFRGYKEGVRGYSRRLGAANADGITGTMIASALLPAVFHQDPRYFVKGQGRPIVRGLYAISNVVVCRGDNRRWQPNYSNVLGNVASAAVSNLYYPATDRHGASLTIENSLTMTMLGAIGNVFQEFVVRRLTPNIPHYEAR